MADPYISVAEFKMRVGGISDGTQDAAIEQVCMAASRKVDGWTGRTFQVPADDDVGSVRTFTVRPLAVGRGLWGYIGYAGQLVTIDDFVELLEVRNDVRGAGVYSDPWDEDFYRPGPSNAQAIDWPYNQLEIIDGSVAFPTVRNGLSVKARWGWPVVPDDIKEVTFLIANRLKGTWTAPFGITGSGELGTLVASTNLTPIMKEMVAPYRVLTI